MISGRSPVSAMDVESTAGAPDRAHTARSACRLEELAIQTLGSPGVSAATHESIEEGGPVRADAILQPSP